MSKDFSNHFSIESPLLRHQQDGEQKHFLEPPNHRGTLLRPARIRPERNLASPENSSCDFLAIGAPSESFLFPRRCNGAIQLRRGGDVRCCGGVAKFSQPFPVAHNQRRYRLDRFRGLAQFLLHAVDLRESATYFFAENGIPFQKVETLGSHAFEDRLEQIKVSNDPLPGSSQEPHPILAAPPGVTVNLPKLALFAGDQRGEWDRALLGVAHQLLDIALGNYGLVLVVNEYSRLGWLAVWSAVGEDKVSVARKLFADPNACPRPCILGEVHLF